MSVPLSVLIVEDSEDDTVLMLLELQRNGYEPTSERVDSAEAMSAALDRQTWDLIISDYSMPRFSMSTALAMVHMKGNITRLAPAVERELREAEMRRERRRAEKERERLVEELEDKSKELGQLLFISSHDLQEPLINIQGFARELKLSLQEMRLSLEEEDIPSAVKEKLAVTIDEDITDSLNYILSSTSKIDTLLKGLLKVSRLGQIAITIEKLNMKDLMAEVVDDFQFQYLDPERPGIIRISGRKEDSNVVYTVEDNGIGIAPEHQETVFQIFQRVDPTASSGEGLGLTIVRRILERHGGKIWLESEPGKGSRFHISLPIGDW